MDDAESYDLAEQVADVLRDRLIVGALKPGQRLAEAALADELRVSRNTLREVFRILLHERLLIRHANRGVFVATPTAASVIDLFRVRRVIEVAAVRDSLRMHPALERTRGALERARAGVATDDWAAVGTANMDFHAALVQLAGSRRMSQYFRTIMAELRVAFVAFGRNRFLHGAFLEENARILTLLEDGRVAEATEALETYLLRSERLLLADFESA